MGYDFEVLEDGDFTLEINEYNHSSNKASVTIKVKKGQKFNIDYDGVRIRER